MFFVENYVFYSTFRQNFSQEPKIKAILRADFIIEKYRCPLKNKANPVTNLITVIPKSSLFTFFRNFLTMNRTANNT